MSVSPIPLNSNLVRLHFTLAEYTYLLSKSFKFQSGATALNPAMTLAASLITFKFQSGATAFSRCTSFCACSCNFKFQSGATAFQCHVLQMQLEMSLNSNLVRLHSLDVVIIGVIKKHFKFQSGATAFLSRAATAVPSYAFKFQSGATAFIPSNKKPLHAKIFKFQSGATALHYRS